MKKVFLSSYKIGDFSLKDIYIFLTSKSKYMFLLSNDGCSMILAKSYLKELKNQSIDEDLMFKLVQHGLGEIQKDGIQLPVVKDSSLYFIIDVTKKCNFDCIYCFRNLNDQRMISMEKLKDICQFILNISHERKFSDVKIQVWGGEPLLAFKRIEYIYQFFKDTDVKVQIDVETNASIITESIAKKLFDMNVNIGISIDGDQVYHNRQRKLVGGGNTSDAVVEGIRRIQKYYQNHFGTITVVTKYNYQAITETINYLTNYLDIVSFKFNIVKDNSNATEARIGLTIPEVKEFANSLFDIVEIYRKTGNYIVENNIKIREDNLLNRTGGSYCLSNGCKGGQNLISFDMNGNIYPCEMTDFEKVKIGSIYKNGQLCNADDLLQMIEEAKRKNVYFKSNEVKKCKNCPWEYYCGGGCTSRIFYSNGKMKYDRVECQLNQILYPKIIESILKNIR